jgi:hypothetical protein
MCRKIEDFPAAHLHDVESRDLAEGKTASGRLGESYRVFSDHFADFVHQRLCGYCGGLRLLRATVNRLSGQQHNFINTVTRQTLALNHTGLKPFKNSKLKSGTKPAPWPCASLHTECTDVAERPPIGVGKTLSVISGIKEVLYAIPLAKTNNPWSPAMCRGATGLRRKSVASACRHQ